MPCTNDKNKKKKCKPGKLIILNVIKVRVYILESSEKAKVEQWKTER